ncbi:phosphotransferase enzyme family protein [Desulforhopalus sp. 52FAK]
MTDFSDILSAFSCNVDSSVRPLGNGNINETYIVDAAPQPFVLQRISRSVFPEPVAVIENYEVIHHHLARKDKAGSSGLVMAAPIYTNTGAVCFVDGLGDCWRAQSYVETIPVDAIDSREQAQSVGVTLAKFHTLFHDLPLGNLKDPLPGFHHLFSYLDAYDKSSGNFVQDYEESLSFCHRIIETFRESATTIERARNRGELTSQTIHGDPKLDNFIFTREGQATGLLDLDTVGAGLIYHDLGDCLRSACSISGESIADKRPPGFDLEYCEWIVAGYFSGDGENRCDVRPELIYDGLMSICFELGLRFFTDHLEGNRYFRVQEDGENLLRAKKQCKLLEEIVRQESVIRKSVASLYKKR